MKLGLFLTLSLFVPFLSFAAPIELKFDSDVSTKLRTQVLNDFDFMSTVTGFRESPLHREIFGKIDGSLYLNWFQSRVKYFGYDSCGGPSAVACVKSKYPNKIWVTGNYTRISHPQIARLMTLYHEARHTEVDHHLWPHAKCPSNFPYRSIWTGKRLAGNYACDSTVYGSYASASVLLNNVSRNCSNCSEKVKADSKLYSDDQVKRVVEPGSIARLKEDFEF